MLIDESLSSALPVSPAEADKIVEAACSQLYEPQATRVRRWYNEKRDVTVKNCWYRVGSIGLIEFGRQI